MFFGFIEYGNKESNVEQRMQWWLHRKHNTHDSVQFLYLYMSNIWFFEAYLSTALSEINFKKWYKVNISSNFCHEGVASRFFN